MTTSASSGRATFRPRARLLKLLGEELISDDVVAITELVKNAHDADASRVTIRFSDVLSDEGSITVTDDGDGMDLEILLHRWMEPAASIKGRKGTRRTRSGRRMLGEKGVGRFAVGKLASGLELISKRRRKAEEIRAVFDWDEFGDDSLMLDDVGARWERRKPITIKPHGTILRMTGLRSRWNERMFRRMCTRLSRLLSPSGTGSNFVICIESDEFPDYSGELKTGFLDRSPYRITASFDGSQSIILKVNGGEAETHLWNGAGDLECGPVGVTIHAFDLDTESLCRVGPRVDVRGWLRHWAGLSIYRDGFRVWPYGEPHDDWLRLDQRRVNNPVVRLSNNQVVGFVDITADGNPGLKDQTNREGLTSGRALEDLRRLMYFVLQVLEADRQTKRRPFRKSTTRKVETAHLTVRMDDEIDRLSGEVSKKVARDLKRLAKNAKGVLEDSAASHQLMINQYAELAAAGQVAAGLHETTVPILEGARSSCEELSSHLNGSGTRATRRMIEAINDRLDQLDEHLKILSPMSGASVVRRRPIDVPREIERYRDMSSTLLVSEGVKMTLNVPEGGILRVEMRPEAFRKVLHLLAVNSVDWLRDVPAGKITLSVRDAGEACELIFSDNGPGIPPTIRGQVFDPMFSGKENGRGMGLTLCRNIVEAHRGTIEVVKDRRRVGASIRIHLPKKRSRARVH